MGALITLLGTKLVIDLLFLSKPTLTNTILTSTPQTISPFTSIWIMLVTLLNCRSQLVTHSHTPF